MQLCCRLLDLRIFSCFVFVYIIFVIVVMNDYLLRFSFLYRHVRNVDAVSLDS